MNTVVKQERRNPVKIVLLMFCACLIALSGVAFSPQQAHARNMATIFKSYVVGLRDQVCQSGQVNGSYAMGRFKCDACYRYRNSS